MEKGESESKTRSLIALRMLPVAFAPPELASVGLLGLHHDDDDSVLVCPITHWWGGFSFWELDGISKSIGGLRMVLCSVDKVFVVQGCF